MKFLKIILLLFILISPSNANTIYNLIKIPNLEIYNNKFIRSAHQSFPVPCVIALKRYVKVSKITLKCNRRNVFGEIETLVSIVGIYSQSPS